MVGVGCLPSPPNFFFIKVGNAEKILKSRTLNGTFLRYLKRCFGGWDCGETFRNKDANWYFLAVSFNDSLEVGTSQKFVKLRTLTGAY